MSDTQATLLLCGTFTRAESVKPLTHAEYNAVARWLMESGRRPASLLDAPREWPTSEGFPRADRLEALLGRGVQMAAALERWQRVGLWVIGRGESAYPDRVRRLLRAQGPPLLFGVGGLARLDAGGVAVVGSRAAPEDALAFSRRCGEACAAAGLQVVSGGARGVDETAVSAALAAGGGAVAVLAERLQNAATARANREAIRDGRLTLVSPYEPEATFTVWRAMERNKVIHALGGASVVAHFTAGSGGTWAGAVERLRANAAGASVPVWVRRAGNDAAGLAELVALGASPLGEDVGVVLS